MRIYISGRMTGYPNHNRPAFDAAEKRLTAQGHFVINPVNISVTFGTAEELAESFRRYYDVLKVCGEDYFERGNPACKVEVDTRVARAVMDADLAAVRSCDAIYLLSGWETSRGAKRELAEALAHKLKIMQKGKTK